MRRPKSVARRARSLVRAAGAEHRLRLYEDEAFLVASAATFLGGALASGDVAIAIATADHRQRIDAQLKARRASGTRPRFGSRRCGIG